MRSTVHVWNAVGYVTRSPRDAGARVPKPRFDRGLVASSQAILSGRFLEKLFGTHAGRLLEMLTRMTWERVPHKPLW